MSEVKANKASTVEAHGAVEDVPLEMRDGDAELLLEGQGTIESTIGELTSSIGKKVVIEVLEDPRLSDLRAQYEGLSKTFRTCSKGVLTWEQVVSAIPNISEFLEGVASLLEAEIYWLNGEDQLVVGDRCDEVPDDTLGLDYNQSRARAVNVSNRGLITLDEFKQKKGQFQVQNFRLIWVESGENPSLARNAYMNRGDVRSYENSPKSRAEILGSLCVLRVSLNLDS